jgi:hypothetical protein
MKALVAALAIALVVLAGCAVPPAVVRDAVPTTTPKTDITNAQAAPAEPFYVLAGPYNIHFVGGASDSLVALPDDPSASAPWAAIQAAMLGSGYDLRPLAGKSVRRFELPMRDTYKGHATRFVALVDGNRTIAAWVFADGLYPGVLSLQEFKDGRDN